MKLHIPTATYGDRITVEQHNAVCERPWLTLNAPTVEATPLDRLPMALTYCADGAPVQMS